MLPTATEILKKSYALYRAHMGLFLVYTLFLIVPLLAKQMYQSVLMIKFFPELTPLLTNQGEIFQSTIPLSSLLLPGSIVIAISLLTFFGLCVLIKVIADISTKNTSQTLLSNLSSTTKIFFPAVVVSILTFLLVFFGLIAFVIPGILFSIWFFFATYGVILDGKKGVQALKHSKSLVNNRWWDVFWIVFATTFIIVVVTTIASGTLKILVTFLQNVTGIGLLGLIGFIGNICIDLLVTPYSAIVSTLIYLELKKR